MLGGVNSEVNKVYSSFNIDKELANTNPVAALTSGKITKNDIGKTVYLSNSAVACQEWIIIGINHDNTSGTVDLICKYQLDWSRLGPTKYSNSIAYVTRYLYDADEDGYDSYDVLSDSESYRYAYIYRGFTDDIKNAMIKSDKQYCTHYVPTTGGYGFATKSRKLNVPSIYELGLDGDYCYNYNTMAYYHLGTTYEYFSNGGSRKIGNLSDNGKTEYWLRDCEIGGSLYGSFQNGMPCNGNWAHAKFVIFNSSNTISTSYDSIACEKGIVAIIRFGKI